MLAFRRAWRLLRTACRRAAGTSVLLDPEVVDAARPVIEAAPYPIERIVRVRGRHQPCARHVLLAFGGPATCDVERKAAIVREFGLAHSKFARMHKAKLANGKLRYMLA